MNADEEAQVMNDCLDQMLDEDEITGLRQDGL